MPRLPSCAPLLLLLCLSSFAVRCGGDGEGPRCVPGSTTSCDCPGALAGVQTCADDGLRYHVCICSAGDSVDEDVDAPDAGGDIDAPEVADTETSTPCDPDPCNGHGVCEQGVCGCATGYSGSWCERCAPGFLDYPECSTDQCFPDPCNGHGACEAGACTCFTGYTGSHCEACAGGYLDYPDCEDDPCDPDPCNGHGACVGGDCDCADGYGGARCEACAEGFVGYPDCVDDPCDPDPCTGHGACVGGGCDCDVGFAGLACDGCDAGYLGYPDCVDDPCEPDPCSGHGACVDGACDCEEAYSGGSCQACAAGFLGYPVCVDDPCDPDPCSGNGACAAGSCDCADGFDGVACDQCAAGYLSYPICTDDPCDPDPCSGHGLCELGACDCGTGYDGAACEACSDGFVGYPTCAADPCYQVSCSGAGDCVDTGGAASCDCDSGYEPDGLDCVPHAGSAQPIVLDGRFDDWDNVPVAYADPSGDAGSTGIDLTTIKIANDADNLYVYMDLGAEIVLKSNQYLVLYIDGDGDSGTGSSGDQLAGGLFKVGSSLTIGSQQKLGHLGQIMSATHVGHLANQAVGKGAERDPVVIDQADIGQSCR